MGLTLSPDKTRITDPADGFQFLGHRVSMRWDDRFGWSPRIEVPKTKAADLRHKVKQLTTRQTLHWSLDDLLQKLNPILRGWAHFYCYCTGAKSILGGLDWYVGDRVWRWMRKKHPTGLRAMAASTPTPQWTSPNAARLAGRPGRAVPNGLAEGAALQT